VICFIIFVPEVAKNAKLNNLRAQVVLFREGNIVQFDIKSCKVHWNDTRHW